MSGVRLSFALSDWEQLGREYPPALEKLTAIRNSLEDRVKKGEDIGRSFHDLAAINRTLNEDSRTTESFRQLDSQNPKAAAKAIFYVKSALVKDKAYELYAKYVDAKRDFERLKRLYELTENMARDAKHVASIAEHSVKAFRHGSATLIAILVVTDQEAEAKEIAALAKEQLDDAKFHKEIDDALAGVVPAPWP
jgi:hypothetical protein